MNALRVSHDQDQKLTKMCKFFFPETKRWMDNYVVIQKQSCKICVKERVILGVDFKEYEESDSELLYVEISNEAKIPWFEFCWKLLNKMLSNQKEINPVYIQEGVLNFGMICFNNSEFQHPIDYLYEIFKQNEKN